MQIIYIYNIVMLLVLIAPPGALYARVGSS